MSGKENQLQATLLRSLASQVLTAEAEIALFAPLDRQKHQRFHGALVESLRMGPTLAEAERAALRGSTPGRQGEVREALLSHLLAPTAIPEQDLPIYVPWLEKHDWGQAPDLPEEQEESAGLSELERALFGARLPRADVAPSGEGATLAEAPFPRQASLVVRDPAGRPARKPKAKEAWPPGAVEPAERSERESKARRPWPPPRATGAHEAQDRQPAQAVRPRSDQGPASQAALGGLEPLPFLTAALEAIGLDRGSFGFLLRYGRYAPEGRRSQIQVGGIGLAEFSERVTSWLEARGATKFPLQVVDEGTGDLTVYLLAP